MKKHATLSLIFLLLIMMALPAEAWASGGVKVGEPPPAFVLEDHMGRKVNMNVFFNKPTIIYFTHNACHYCTQIIAFLKRAEAKFGNENLRIIGINVMAKDKRLVKAYKEELGFTFPMLAGNKGQLLEAYKIAYVPMLVFVDQNRKVYKVIGHYIHEPELHSIIKEIMGLK